MLKIKEIVVVLEKVPLPFDGEHSGAHLGEYAGLIGASGSDLQHFFKGSDVQMLCLECYSKRLGNGLSGTNGESPVFVCNAFKSGVQKKVAGNFFDGRQYIFIRDPLFSEGGN